MITFNLDVRETEDFIDKVLGRLAFKVQRYLIEKYPRSFMNKINVVKHGSVWTVGFNDEIMIYFESGTRPHEIKAKFKNALAFEWPKSPVIPNQPGLDGRYKFKKVKHPGTKGAHILDELENNPQIIDGFLQEAINEVIK